jgi:hypothetical protein
MGGYHSMIFTFITIIPGSSRIPEDSLPPRKNNSDILCHIFYSVSCIQLRIYIVHSFLNHFSLFKNIYRNKTIRYFSFGTFSFSVVIYVLFLVPTFSLSRSFQYCIMVAPYTDYAIKYVNIETDQGLYIIQY